MEESKACLADQDIFDEDIIEYDEFYEESFDDPDDLFETGEPLILKEPPMGLLFNFKVKASYKELFMRINEAAEEVESTSDFCFFKGQHTTILTCMLESINVKTMKINSAWLKSKIRNSAETNKLHEELVKRLDGFVEFIPEKEALSWAEFWSIWSGIEVSNIYERAEDVYCEIMLPADRAFEPNLEAVEALIGTLGEAEQYAGHNLKIGWQGHDRLIHYCKVDNIPTPDGVMCGWSLSVSNIKEASEKVGIRKVFLPDSVVLNMNDMAQEYVISIKGTLSENAIEVIEKTKPLLNNLVKYGYIFERGKLFELFEIFNTNMNLVSLYMNWSSVYSSMAVQDDKVEDLCAGVSDDRLKKTIKDKVGDKFSSIFLYELNEMMVCKLIENASSVINGRDWDFETRVIGIVPKKINEMLKAFGQNQTVLEYCLSIKEV